jgi:hypothetical protein
LSLAFLLLTACPGGTDTKDEFPDDTSETGEDTAEDTDADGDGYPDSEDNCDDVANEDQADLDEDLIGDACDPDVDGDNYDGAVDDCDDTNADINPAIDEICGDATDNDCDGDIDEDDAADAGVWYPDVDADGYGDANAGVTACESPADHITDGTDCDDTDPTVYPDADEFCDGLDNDCDGDVDEDLAITLYVDGDGDGYGDASMPVVGCDDVGDLVVDSTDCDDTDATVYPDAEELCDDLDNDCDTEIDEVEACESSCGDGVLDEGEEQDPPESIFSTVDVDDLTCRWDFSEVEQLYCNGGCSWAGDLSCDDADADIFCKLRTGNPLSEASSYTVETALSAPGFPCPSGYTDVYTDRGVSETVYYTDLDILATHGPGEVVTNPVCTDP